MNKHEIGMLLGLASGFDRRVVDPLTIEAWASVPEFANASYVAAKAETSRVFDHWAYHGCSEN